MAIYYLTKCTLKYFVFYCVILHLTENNACLCPLFCYYIFIETDETSTMLISFICKFSSNDPDFPFKEGKVYTAYTEVKGFNHLSTHIKADNNKSVRIETSSLTEKNSVVWIVRDERPYSKYTNYASFMQVCLL